MFQKTATPAFYTPRFGRLPLVALALILAASGALAEDVPEPSEELEQVTVTGSRIKRTQQQDVATPLTSYDFEELRNLGVDDPRDLIQLLPSNVGAQNNADSLSQNYTVGTSNINLRGLGVSSTLVLAQWSSAGGLGSPLLSTAPVSWTCRHWCPRSRWSRSRS